MRFIRNALLGYFYYATSSMFAMIIPSPVQNAEDTRRNPHLSAQYTSQQDRHYANPYNELPSKKIIVGQQFIK